MSYISEKIQLQSAENAVLHFFRTGQHPGILQKIIKYGHLFSNAQVFPGVNTLKINVCVDSDS